MAQIAIFASGNGTNAEAIMKYFKDNKKNVVKLVVSNNKKALVLQKAEHFGVQSIVFPKQKLELEPQILVDILNENKIDIIVLAGFMCLIPELITDKWKDKIINIHPSLLPKFAGKGMYGLRVHQAVIDAGDKVSGITIHLVNERYDQGEILFFAQCEVMPGDTAETLAQRIHKLEHEHFPRVINELALK